MKERGKIESEIRDWLVGHLDFIAPDLKLIDKEFHLPDEVGASGYIDILCKDSYNNFVIIEIKRSEASARQTISEILKYHALLKHNFGARESEIKIIIISTNWKELIRPYSETVYRTTLDITGYQITIDEHSEPKTIAKVEPLGREFISRKFAYWYGLYMFETKDQRTSFYNDFKPYLLKNDLEDFVLVSTHGDLTDRRVIFPWGVILAYQKQSIETLLEIVNTFSEEDRQPELGEDEFDTAKEYQKYLESELIDAIDTLGHQLEAEDCFPQKVGTMLHAENWEIENIERFGLFKNDPRYDDKQLLDELIGLDGNSELAFWGIAESSQTERFKEIREECQNALLQTAIWLNAMNLILKQYDGNGKRFRLTLNIFNQPSLLVALYHIIVNKEPNYLPGFFLAIDDLDTNETTIYHGSVSWNLNTPTAHFLKPFPDSEKGEWLYRLYSSPDNDKDADDLNLRYTIAKYSLIEEKNSFQGFVEAKGDTLIQQCEYIWPFLQFAVTIKKELEVFVNNFNRTFFKMPRL